jgi:hypothetical protein
MSLASFCSARHLLINFREAPPVSITDTLACDGLKRHIALSTPYSFSAGEIIKGSKLICALPEKIADIFTRRYKLKATQLPIILPTYPVCMEINILCLSSPEIRWLTTLIRTALTPLPPKCHASRKSYDG